MVQNKGIGVIPADHFKSSSEFFNKALKKGLLNTWYLNRDVFVTPADSFLDLEFSLDKNKKIKIFDVNYFGVITFQEFLRTFRKKEIANLALFHLDEFV